MAKEEKTKGPKVTVQLELEVEHEWLDFVLNYNDMFGFYYIGHWARGVLRAKKPNETYGRWLIYDQAEGEEGVAHGEEPDRKQAILFFRLGHGSLPKNWYILDEALVSKAWVEGVKRFGVNWYDNGETDANTYDWCIQKAIFGELTYC